MSTFFPTDWQNYLLILLVFVRILGLMLIFPFFSHKTIPVTVKLLLALSISFAVFPFVKSGLPALDSTLGTLALAAIRESVIGFLMGFVAFMTFEAINLASQFVGFQMGFGFGGLVDPQNQSQVSVLVPLNGWIALMIFLLLDLHHEVLYLFVKSFEITAPTVDKWVANESLMNLLLAKVGHLFVVSVQIAAPFTLLVFCSNAVIGVLARMMPQMNIILFSFPITILIGIFAIYVVAPDLMAFMESLLGNISTDIVQVLRTL